VVKRIWLLSSLAFWVAGCGTISQPGVRVTGAHLQDFTLESLTLVFDLEIENPYPVPLPLADVDYRLASSGACFLSGNMSVQGSVPARQKKVIPLPAKVVYASLFKTVQSVKPGAVVPYEAEMGLSADLPALGRRRLPIRKDGQFPVPVPPELQVQDVAWKIGLQETRGTMYLKTINRNQFAVNIKKLQAAFEVGGVDIGCSGIESPIGLAANGGEATTPVFLAVEGSKLGLSVLGVITGKGGAYRLKGAAEVETPFGLISFPIDSPGQASFRRAR